MDLESFVLCGGFLVGTGIIYVFEEQSALGQLVLPHLAPDKAAACTVAASPNTQTPLAIGSQERQLQYLCVLPPAAGTLWPGHHPDSKAVSGTGKVATSTLGCVPGSKSLSVWS